MKLMQMVSSQEKVHYGLAVATGGTAQLPVPSDAGHHQSATKLPCKLETNLLNNVFSTFYILKLNVIHSAYDSPLTLVKCFGLITWSYKKVIKLQSTQHEHLRNI